MKSRYVSLSFSLVVVMCAVVSCNFLEREDNSPTAPLTSLANYAQMPGGSITVIVNGEQHQLNLALSAQPTFPYKNWFYAEINEQLGIGKAPGVDQVAVNLNNVVFTFSGLPTELTTMVAAIKSGSGDIYTELGRYAAVNGTVTIPVANGDLMRYFGATHFSVWFQPIGGANGIGVNCGSQLDVSGTLPGGQQVTFSQSTTFGKALCFGMEPVVLPTPVVPAAPACKAVGAACTLGSECCNGQCGCNTGDPSTCQDYPTC